MMLHYAVKCGQLELVKYLLTHNLNEKSILWLNSYNKKILKVLVDYGYEFKPGPGPLILSLDKLC